MPAGWRRARLALAQARAGVGGGWEPAEVDYVHRSGWGARAPKHEPQRIEPGAQRGLAVHHSGSHSENRDDHAQCAGVVQAIQRFHQDGRGWSDIAYSHLVCGHGYTFEGRGWGVRPASQGTNEGNASWQSVCYLGADPILRAGDALDQALHYVRASLVGVYPSAYRVWPHLRFHSTACPGGALRDWCRQWPD